MKIQHLPLICLLAVGCLETDPPPEPPVPNPYHEVLECEGFIADQMVNNFPVLERPKILPLGEQLLIMYRNGMEIRNGVNLQASSGGTSEYDIKGRQNLAYICSGSSISTMDESLNRDYLIQTGCNTIAVDDDGQIYFSKYPFHLEDGNRIYTISEDGEEELFSQPYWTLAACSAFESLTFGPDNTLWATNCSQEIVKFQDGAFEEVINANNSPIHAEVARDELFVLRYQNAMIVIAGNGASFYQILKYQNGEWVELKSIIYQDGESLPELDNRMLGSVPTSAFIKGDRLFVSTIRATCQGIQYFDLHPDQPLEEGEYGVFQIPGREDLCIDAMALSEDNKLYFVDVGRRLVGSNECP